MKKKFILALDQGTTSSRAILFDHGGSLVAVAQREFPQIFPKAGWVEHDPMEIWNSQYKVMHEALQKAGTRAAEIAAIGITNQRETALIWDRESGEPLCNAIVWQDRRTSERCDELKALGKEALIRERTGLVADAYFSATKWEWMLQHVEGARSRAEAGELALGTVDSWLVWKLTGGAVHATDVSNASRTMLYNIHSLDWDEELLQLFSIPRSMLPEVRPSSGLFGETAEGILASPVPVAGIAGDQQAATFGQMCLEPGSVKCTYGTGCFILCNTGETPVASDNQLLTTIAWQIEGRTTYALEGSIFTGGAVVQWLRDGLGLIKSSSDIEDLASSVEDNGGVYFVPAFTGLGAPHWDQYARGMIAGLTRGVSSGHIARAALEGIAFQVSEVMEAMAADAGMPLQELKVDGGAVVNDLLMQLQADIAGIPLTRPEITETTAMGAAYLAGLAVEFWSGMEALADQWAVDRVFSDAIGPERRSELIQGWNKAVGRASGWESD